MQTLAFRTFRDVRSLSAYGGKADIDPKCRALQENFVEWADAVLHQCIRPLIGAFELRAIMDISAPAISLADRPQWAIWVTSVRKRREDRSSISFLILSQTSAGKIF